MIAKTQGPSINNDSDSNKEDTFTKLVGEFGRWQFIVFATVSLVKLSSSWVQLGILFLTPRLTFRCMELPNATEEIKNSTCYDGCLKYSYDTAPFEETIISEWNLVCERQWLASFTQTLLQLGILMGSVVFGFLSDRYGRKHTFLTAVVLMIILGLAIPFSPNYEVFTALRTLLGIASAGTMVVSFVIVMETVGPGYRELVGCLFQMPFVIGHMTTPLFAFYFRTWSSYTLALGIPPLLYLGYFFTVSESPRWLLSMGRVEEATAIVERAARMNKKPTLEIQETLTKIATDITSRSEAKRNYSDLFHPSLRMTTVYCCILWFIFGVTYFGLNQYISQSSPDPFLSVFLAGAMQVPANIMSIWLTRTFRRCLILSVTFTATGSLILILYFVPQYFPLTITLTTLGVSCASIIGCVIYIHTSELYPTVVRNMGMGACSTSMRLGSMLAPFIANTSGVAPWIPTAVLGLAPVVAGGLSLLLRETKGTVLLDNIGDSKLIC